MFNFSTLRCGFWGLALALLLPACSSLPYQPVRPVSVAITDYAQTSLAAIAAPVLDADEHTGRSGFRLLPEAHSAFQTRLELIRLATRTLDLQYYLLQGDATGRHLMRALSEAAARGVRVRVLVDDLYTAGEDALLTGLAAQPNVEVRLFNPFASGRSSLLTRFLAAGPDLARVNRRMHNKLFVADNVAALAGGRNIGDEYFMRSASSNFVDLDVFIVGPVVRDLSSTFDRYWNSDHAYPVATIVPTSLTQDESRAQFAQLTAHASANAMTRAEPLPPELAFLVSLPEELAQRKLNPLVLGKARVLADPLTKINGLNETSIEGTVHEAVVTWFRAAREEVFMVSPYFVPGAGGVAAMAEARKAGIHLVVYTNSLAASDEPLVNGAYARYRPEMLKLGVELHEISPTLAVKRKRLGLFGTSRGALHVKMAIVDYKAMFLGSMNLDARSATLNTELGLIIESPELVAQILPRMDRASGYNVKLGTDGQSVEWIEEDGDGDPRTNIVHLEEPETTAWLRFKVWLLSKFVPEGEL